MAYIIEYLPRRIYNYQRIAQVWHPMLHPPIELYFEEPKIKITYICGCGDETLQSIKSFDINAKE